MLFGFLAPPAMTLFQIKKQGGLNTTMLSYLDTLPDASPSISFSTSSTLTWLKSPKIVCFRHEAAAAKFNALASSPG
jgi:hypothetical protein